ncbi:AAA family ATPase [Saccharopolyspora gloriosae]|uniref:Gluconate kinase n=1 Tax=Saccharopolyspora gloriosae TaxID=455344 RepID=A0A840NII9_9PSEU|nr:hypothetical protein [Saccharopolyspora gloriosae]
MEEADENSVGERLPAAVAESHTAVLLFTGDRAYKVKKPVDFGFLDFSTTGARERACRREVDLNRRLAPDVYLDVAQALDGNGRTCDWIVVMRRMPAERRLSTVVRQRGAPLVELERIARVLASFHSTARTGADIAAAGRAPALRGRWSDNVAGVEPFVGDVLDSEEFEEIARLALEYVDGRGPLLEERARRGCVVDGHGDLVADDIFCLDDGPRLLDCLEFDDELRHVDGLDDAAFLAMDLERLGAADLGRRFLRWYREFSGAEAADSLAHHYLAYRAFVRAKVACLQHAQGAAGAADEARLLADMTRAHLRAGQVRLVLVGGLPGTGKSTVSGSLADRLGAVLLSTDRVRRELAAGRGEPAHAGYGRGLYAAEHVHGTYSELLARARTLLEHGESVVLDASWSKADERARARDLVQLARCASVELRCTAPGYVTAGRIADRTGDLSDATPDIAARMAAEFEEWPESLPVDTSGSPQEAIAAARRAFTEPG